jgi:hypothetical protein
MNRVRVSQGKILRFSTQLMEKRHGALQATALLPLGVGQLRKLERRGTTALLGRDGAGPGERLGRRLKHRKG